MNRLRNIAIAATLPLAAAACSGDRQPSTSATEATVVDATTPPTTATDVITPDIKVTGEYDPSSRSGSVTLEAAGADFTSAVMFNCVGLELVPVSSSMGAVTMELGKRVVDMASDMPSTLSENGEAICSGEQDPAAVVLASFES